MNFEKELTIQTRPEIRKGSIWDIRLVFSNDFLERHQLKGLHLEKPKVVKDGYAYLCIKVRSKILKKELGFNKVANIENDKGYILINESGVAVLKVKFTQRPRSVFHKHADVMILVVSVRSSATNAILTTSEHDLVFRGGTGSAHSADSKKRQSLRKTELDEESSETDSYAPPKKMMRRDSFSRSDVQPFLFPNQLDSFDYLSSVDELKESLQLEEWAKQYGIDTPPLIDNNEYQRYNYNGLCKFENEYSDDFNYGRKQVDINTQYESLLRLKEEIKEIIDKKIQEFSAMIDEKLERQKREIEKITQASIMFSASQTPPTTFDTTKLCSLKMK